MAAFAPLLDLLAEVLDPRRAEGKLYNLPYGNCSPGFRDLGLTQRCEAPRA